MVVTNKAVLDFATPDHSMRLPSVHPGTSVAEVHELTGFELAVPGEVPPTRPPSAEELKLIRERLDPGGRRDGSWGDQTRLTELLGSPAGRAGRDGLRGGRAAGRGASAAGGLGLLASATMSPAELRTAIAEVRARTAAPFGVNLRADAPDAGERIEAIIAGRVRWPRSPRRRGPS